MTNGRLMDQFREPGYRPIPSYRPTKDDRKIGLIWYPCTGACGNYIPGPLYVKMHRLCIPCQRRRGLDYGPA